jgi:hypothetical protein
MKVLQSASLLEQGPDLFYLREDLLVCRCPGRTGNRFYTSGTVITIGRSPDMGADQFAKFFGILDHFNLDFWHRLPGISRSLDRETGDSEQTHKRSLSDIEIGNPVVRNQTPLFQLISSSRSSQDMLS